MKRIILSIGLVLAALISFGQAVPVRETSPSSFTNKIQRGMFEKNFVLPRVGSKPLQRPSLYNNGSDSLGTQVYSLSDTTVYTYIGGDVWAALGGSLGAISTATLPLVKTIGDVSINYDPFSQLIFNGTLASRSVVVTSMAQLRTVTNVSTQITYTLQIDSQASRTFRYDAADVTTADDSAMTIVNTDNKRFKAVVQDGWINVKWFGATGNSITDDYYNFQRCIDYVVRNTAIYKKIYVPLGKYKVSNGLVVWKDADGNGAPEFVNIEIKGDAFSYGVGGTTATSIIYAAHNDNFALAIQFGKGCRVSNLGFEGSNDISSITRSQVYSGDKTQFIVGGARSNTKSPYSAIVIDPFHATTPTDDRYPDMTRYYTGIVSTGTSGSTDVMIDNVYIQKFVVGIIFSPNGTSQNAEACTVSNAWIGNTADAISCAQSQTRTIQVKNLKVWGGVHTIFNATSYGQGNGVLPAVYDANIAGYNYQLLHLTGGWSGGSFTNVYAELMFRLGNWGTSTNGLPMSFVNCHFNIPSTEGYASAKFIGNEAVFTGCYLVQYNNRTGYITANSNNLTFINCMLSGPVIPYRDALGLASIARGMAKVKYINCWTYENPALGDGYVSSELVENSVRYDVVARSTLNVNFAWIKTNPFGNPVHPVTRAPLEFNYEYGLNGESGAVSFLAASDVLRTIDFNANGTATFKSANPDQYMLNDIVGQQGITATIDGESSVSSTILGVVTVVDADSTVHLASVTNINPTSVQKTNIGVSTIWQSDFQEPVVGTITSGSNIITDIRVRTRAFSLRVGTPVVHPSFPYYTRITAINIAGKTITVSKNASATDANAVIEFTRLEGRGTATKDPNTISFTSFSNTYDTTAGIVLKGSFIKNVGTDTTILGWQCTRTGFLATTRPPVFQQMMISGKTWGNEMEDLGTVAARWKDAHIKTLFVDSIDGDELHAPNLQDSVQLQIVYTNDVNGKVTRGPLPVTADNWGTQTTVFNYPLSGAGIDGDGGSLDTTTITGVATKSEIAALQAQIDGLPGGTEGMNVKNTTETGDTLSYILGDTAFMKRLEAGANVLFTVTLDKIIINATPGTAEINTLDNTFSATDSSAQIPAGSIIQSILVKPTTSLTGFKIGTQSDDDAYLVAVPIEATGEFQIIMIPIHVITATKLYFAGITSSTDIKIIYKPLHE